MWAPNAEYVDVELRGSQRRVVRLKPESHGYHSVQVENVPVGTKYSYRLAGGPPVPDPASRHQPEGVHGPSQVVDANGFRWSDQGWHGHERPDLIFYEIHVGTYTKEGTFDAIHGTLPYLRDLGVTALELMPVAQFPGQRNWGYDGVNLFAVQNSYGGPDGLRRLVNACHAAGISVFLDVVYNHLGPEGDRLAEFGPYYRSDHRTPWGPALNFDGRESDDVRHFFLKNALHWLDEYHMDGLRLDAVHTIIDRTSRTFLEDLTDTLHGAAHAHNKPFHIVAESIANDPRLITPRDEGGIGIDAVWNDDFHHALHAVLTGERDGHYADFGSITHVAKTYTHGFALDGDYSHYRGRRHGKSSLAIPADRFVICIQNHDQVGNRANGERMGQLIPFEAQKLAAAATLLAPNLPQLFMGEEYGDAAPFYYFVDHSDKKLLQAVRKGRMEEFRAHRWPGEPPDPGAEETFRKSKLDPALRANGRHAMLHRFYKRLLELRRKHPALASLNKETLHVRQLPHSKTLVIRRWHGDEEALLVLHLQPEHESVDLPMPTGTWQRLVSSVSRDYGGPGSSVPLEVTSAGQVAVTLAPWCAVLLGKGAAA